MSQANYERLVSENRRLTKENDSLKYKLYSIISKGLTYDFPERWGLTNRECRILHSMYTQDTFTKDAFMQDFYRSKNIFVMDKIYDVYVSKLRKKIREAELPVEIVTQRGVGYSLSEDSKLFLSQYVITLNGGGT